MFNPFRFFLKPIIEYNDDNKMIYYNDRKGTIKDFKYDNDGNLLEVIVNNKYVEEHNNYNENGFIVYHRKNDIIEQYKYDDKNRVTVYTNNDTREVKKIYYFDDFIVEHVQRKSNINIWNVYSYSGILYVSDIDKKIQEYLDNLPKFLEESLGKQV